MTKSQTDHSKTWGSEDEKEQDKLLQELRNLIVQHGERSPEVKAFVQAHEGNNEFVDLAAGIILLFERKRKGDLDEFLDQFVEPED